MYLYDQKYLYCENGFNVIYYFDANLYFQHHYFSLTWSLLLSILKSVVLPNNFCQNWYIFNLDFFDE